MLALTKKLNSNYNCIPYVQTLSRNIKILEKDPKKKYGAGNYNLWFLKYIAKDQWTWRHIIETIKKGSQRKEKRMVYLQTIENFTQFTYISIPEQRRVSDRKLFELIMTKVLQIW